MASNKEDAVFLEIRENQKEINKICERAHKALISEHNINVTHAPAIATIAYRFLQQTIAYLNEKKTPGEDISVNVMQLFDMGISYRENDEGEKTGNFTPYMIPGQEYKLMVKDDGETEDEEE